jgi:hypothetical protein
MNTTQVASDIDQRNISCRIGSGGRNGHARFPDGLKQKSGVCDDLLTQINMNQYIKGLRGTNQTPAFNDSTRESN